MAQSLYFMDFASIGSRDMVSLRTTNEKVPKQPQDVVTKVP